MSEVDLKKKLINAIELSSNEELLQEVYRLLQIEYGEEPLPLILPVDIERKIEISRQQIQNGQVISNDEANNEMDEWLKGL